MPGGRAAQGGAIASLAVSLGLTYILRILAGPP